MKKEIKLGDRLEKGDDLDGATLCDWCNCHFKGDGKLERCNDCVETNSFLDKKRIKEKMQHKELEELLAVHKLEIAELDHRLLLVYFSKCSNCGLGFSNIGVYSGGEYYACESCHIESIITSVMARADELENAKLEVTKENTRPHYDWILEDQDHLRVGREFDYDGWNCQEMYLKDGTQLNCKELLNMAQEQDKNLVFVEFEEDKPKLSYYYDLDKCPSHLFGGKYYDNNKCDFIK